MCQNILPVAGAVVQPAQQLDQFVIQTVDIGFQHSTFALLTDAVFHLTLCFLHHFLDLGRMNPAVVDEFFQCDPGNLTAHMVETGQGDCLRRIVDDDIDTGQRFQRTDVPSLSADDASLHLVVGQRYHRNRRLRNLIGSALGNGQRDVAAGLVLALVLELLLIAGQPQRLFVRQLILQTLQDVFLCLLPCQL